MSSKVATIKHIKGMLDVLPEQSGKWQKIEQDLRALTAGYGYQEIRLPILEPTHLFKRSIGEVTDIVGKEMFTFLDHNEESLTLRPEGTAGCVRSCIEHALLRNQQMQKLWYLGPMFRYEAPQEGRLRQFTQFGLETFNVEGAGADVEHLVMMARFFKTLGLQDVVRLEINSLGDQACREQYRTVLVDYLNQHQAILDEDSKRRLHTNPLRILDSKNPEMAQMIAAAPNILEVLSPEAREHFETVQAQLLELGIPFTINPRIVRGLDYYNRTVYEWISDKLGAQSTVCAGGRYDKLVERLGGPASTAVGCAMGLERILITLEKMEQTLAKDKHAYLICFGAAAESKRLFLAERIRNTLPELHLHVPFAHQVGLKNQMKKADKSGADWVLIIGDDELAEQKVCIKFLREDRPQEIIAMEALSSMLGER